MDARRRNVFRTLGTMVSVTEGVGGATTGCRLPIDRFEVPFTWCSY